MDIACVYGSTGWAANLAPIRIYTPRRGMRSYGMCAERPNDGVEPRKSASYVIRLHGPLSAHGVVQNRWASTRMILHTRPAIDRVAFCSSTGRYSPLTTQDARPAIGRTEYDVLNRQPYSMHAGNLLRPACYRPKQNSPTMGRIIPLTMLPTGNPIRPARYWPT